MKHIFKWLSVFILVCYVASSNANNLSSDFRFHNVNNSYGISMRQASSVCKDNSNFIWVSTNLGILRLTNDDSRVYHLPYESSMVQNIELISDDNVLWAISRNGLIFKYDRVFDKFVLEFNLVETINIKSINIFSALTKGNNTLWLATSDGLYMYRSSEKRAKKMISDPITSLEWYSNDHFFAVSLNEILLFDIISFKSEVKYSGLLSEYFFSYSTHYDNRRKRLWIGSNLEGLFYFDISNKELYEFMPGKFPVNPIMDFEEIGNETLLVGIDGQGIWSINEESLSIEHIYKEDEDNPESIHGNGVYDIFHDKEENIVWVCTFSGGVSYSYLGESSSEHIAHQRNQSNSLSNNNVNHIIEDSEKNLWFATNNGISIRKANGNQWTHLYSNNKKKALSFLTLHEDRKGQIWAGSYSSGIYVIDAKSGKQMAHYSSAETNTSFRCDFVFNIYEDYFGDLWFCGNNSEVLRYIPDKNHFQRYYFQPATKIVQYNDSLMLLACSYGLVELNKNTGIYSTLVENQLVNDILVLDDDIWFGTGGNGLVCFQPELDTIKQFTTENGLLSNYVNSVIEADNKLWLGTENGLCSFSPYNGKVKTYPGIFSRLSLSFNKNSHCELDDERLVMGTNNGAVLFDPSEMSNLKWEGRIFFQDLKIVDQSVRKIPTYELDRQVDEIESIELKNNQNSFKLELLSLGSVSDAKFSWKLVGLNTEWTMPSEYKLISYNNIPSGSYVLNVRMYDSALAQIVDVRSLKIKIASPFWATWWFFSVLFLVISIVIYSVFWFLLNRIRHYHVEKKIRFFTSTAHEIRSSLSLIKAPVEELINEKNISEQGKNNLRLATEQANHINNVVNQLMDFQKIDVGKEKIICSMIDLPSLIACRVEMFESLAAMKNIEIKKEFAKKQYESAVDEIQIGKVIDNLISNAIKYSRSNSTIQICFDGNESDWTLSIIDQGIGINKRDQKRVFNEFYRGKNAINSNIVGSGIGLLLVNNIVRLHNGTVKVSSVENKGTSFTVRIPFKKVMNSELLRENEAEHFSDNFVTEESVTLNPINPEIQAKRLKILLVEDNDKLLRFMQVHFAREYEVLTAENGITAWKILQNNIPDIVISDVIMPQMNGFELCKLMKSTFETSHIPLVLLSALDNNDNQLYGIELGADDFLTKPFDINLLHKKIRTIIQNRKTIRDKALRLIQTENKEPVLKNTINDKFLKKMLEVVKANIDNPQFSKDDFAKAMKVSGSLLYKKVKALTNLSPLDFIKSVRMDYALELLQTNKYSITEVSEMCGYASSGYFSTVFKRYFGKTPSEL